MKYRELTCIVCGEKAVDRSRAQNRMYCSKQCRMIHFRQNLGAKLGLNAPSCVHNNGVLCEDHKCGNCGWNPEVEQKRKEDLAYGKE